MITFDQTKRKRNLESHGIDIASLEPFFDGDLLTREDARVAYGEVRYQSIGWFEDECIFVAWTPRQDDWPHIISARKAEKYEREAWKRAFRR